MHLIKWQLSVNSVAKILTHLNVAIVALGHKGHTDREEVIRLSGNAELQAAGLVVGIDDR